MTYRSYCNAKSWLQTDPASREALEIFLELESTNIVFGLSFSDNCIWTERAPLPTQTRSERMDLRDHKINNSEHCVHREYISVKLWGWFSEWVSLVYCFGVGFKAKFSRSAIYGQKRHEAILYRLSLPRELIWKIFLIQGRGLVFCARLSAQWSRLKKKNFHRNLLGSGRP